MKIEKTHLVWFSATASTKQIIELIAKQCSPTSVEKYDITKSDLKEDIQMAANDLLIVGMPVYAGRIPAVADKSLQRFKGCNTPAIIVCVYGNRDYEDALLELKDTVQANGFIVVSAAAFIAQHSIFPVVAANRPDEKDKDAIRTFGEKSATLISALDNTNNLPSIKVKGKHPYKKPGKVPLSPKTDKTCNKCGLCVKLCPTNAIPAFNPKITLGSKCFACARCIAVCPQHARHFGGIIYRIAGNKFIKANSTRKEPETMYIEIC